MATQPSLAGFIIFVRGVMKIDVLYLPADDLTIEYAYDAALSMVNPALVAARSPVGSWTPYTRAVYNLGGSNLVNYAQDQPGRTYFSQLRNDLGIAKFQAGVVSGASDGGTATSLLNPEFMKELTLGDLQNLKDPWGRQYLAIAQQYGSLWGLS